MKIKDEALEYAKLVLAEIMARNEVPIGGEQFGNMATVMEAHDRIVTALSAPQEAAPVFGRDAPEADAPITDRLKYLVDWSNWSDQRGCYFRARIAMDAIEHINKLVAGPAPTAERVEITRMGEVSRETRTTTFEATGGAGRTTVATGGFVSYYLADVPHPQRTTQPPYVAECEDITQALRMTFDEGCEFKAIWRTAAARMGNTKPGHDPIYDAEKRVHYASRSLRYETWLAEQARDAVPLMFRGDSGPSGKATA